MTITVKVNAKLNFVPFEMACSNCDSILVVSDLSDIEVEDRPLPGEMGSDIFVTINCPVCHRKVSIPKNLHNTIIKLKS